MGTFAIMSTTKTSPPEIPNLPLHLLIEKHAADIPFGQITYTFRIVNGIVQMNTIEVNIARRRRYKT